VVEQLPDLIDEQRQASIQQVFDNLVAEEEEARDLLDETRQTLDAGNQMAVALNTTIESAEELARFVLPANRSTFAATNSRPFDVVEYGSAATQLAVAARELNSLLTTLNAATPELERLGKGAAAGADHFLSRAFVEGVVLILVLAGSLVLAGLILVRLAYPFLVKKLTRDGIIRKPET